MRLVRVEPGTFMMGRGDERGLDGVEKWEIRQEELPRHRVTLSQGFRLGVCLVTQYQWEQVMGRNPSRFPGRTEEERKRLPVDNVSWEECQEFCRRLGAREGRRYRLPAEAEWEFACRAGTATAFWWGNDIGWDRANYDGRVTGTGETGKWRKGPTPVDLFPANPWGLHDMHGNLWQWCQDRYADYPAGSVTDPRGRWLRVGDRVLRGGAYDYPAWKCRAASRLRIPRGTALGNDSFGCRVVLCDD
jgi:formylglycine-generating enzyme required for sulfatase activity